MAGKATLLIAPSAALAAAVAAAQQPAPLLQAQPGLWEISGVPGSSAPLRQCVANVATLARFEHRAKPCAAKVLKSAGDRSWIEYSCGAAGFGHSEVELITPRSLKISTQGISDGLPFNYVLQAHRIDDCPKSASVIRH